MRDGNSLPTWPVWKQVRQLDYEGFGESAYSPRSERRLCLARLRPIE